MPYPISVLQCTSRRYEWIPGVYIEISKYHHERVSAPNVLVGIGQQPYSDFETARKKPVV